MSTPHNSPAEDNPYQTPSSDLNFAKSLSEISDIAQPTETAAHDNPNNKLSVKEKIGYGFGDMASNLYYQFFSIWQMMFYTDVFGLKSSAAGTMMLVTKIVDAVADPVIGTIADRTKTRWGHFRPYLVWIPIPLAIASVFAFTTPNLSGDSKVVYAYATMIIMMVLYSAINIPYSALLGVLTPSSKERTSASSYRFVMALLPVFLIVYTTIPIVKWFGDGNPVSPFGWQMSMAIYAGLAILLFFVTFFMTREKVEPAVEQTSSLKTDLLNLTRNVPWMVLCIVGLAALIYLNIRNGVIVYFLKYAVPNGGDHIDGVMSTGAFAFIVGVMLTSPLSKKFGKPKLFIGSMALTLIATAGFYFVPNDSLAMVWVGNALLAFVSAPSTPLLWAMYADTADYSEWKWKRRSTGLIFSAALLAQKMGLAIGSGCVGWLLEYYHYTPNVAQAADTIEGMKLMMSYIPAVFVGIAFVALFFYRLDDKTVAVMDKELAQRRAASPEPHAA